MNHAEIDNIVNEYGETFDYSLLENLFYKLSQDGDLNGIKYLISQIPDVDKQHYIDSIKNAIGNNDIILFKFLLESCEFYDNDIMEMTIYCCEYSRFDLFKYMLDRYKEYELDQKLTPNSNDFYAKACESGCIEISKYLLENTKISFGMFVETCRLCNMDMVKFVEDRIESEINYELAFFYACHGGRVENIKYLEQHLCRDKISLERVVFVHSNHFVLSRDVSNKCYDIGFYFACIGGHLSAVEYLKNHIDKPDFVKIFIKTCMNSHLHIINYLSTIYGENIFGQNLISQNEIDELFVYSCENGYIHVVKFILEKYNVSGNKIIDGFNECCQCNNMNIAKYLIEMFKIVDVYKALQFICLTDNLDNFKYVSMFLSDFHDKLGKLFFYACQNDAIKIVKYLYNDTLINYLDKKYMNKLIRWHSFRVIKFLLDNNQHLYDEIDYSLLLRRLCRCDEYTALLFFMNKAIDANKMSEYDIIKLVCIGNYTNQIQFVLDQFPNVDIHYDNDKLFLDLCLYGDYESFEIAKILISHFPEIDIHCHNGVCFTTNNPAISKWLESGCYLPGKNIKCAI